MLKKLFILFNLLLLTQFSFSQCGQTMFLNNWTAQGGSSDWQVQPGNNSVIQIINGTPTFFVSDFDLINVEFEGKFMVGTTGDNDFVGFVFGYKDPIGVTNNQDYYLFATTEGNNTQTVCNNFFGHIEGTYADYDFWNYNVTPPSTLTTYLCDNTTFAGWVIGVTYNFKCRFTSTKIIIYIDGVEIVNVDGCFHPGRFGFYNHSQDNVTYSDFTYKLVSDFDIADDQICIGESADVSIFCDNSFQSPYSSIKWDMGDNTVYNNVTTVNHVYANPGIYTVTLTTEDINGCMDNISKTITVVQQEIDLGNDIAYCTNVQNSRLLTTNNGDLINYLWSTGETTPTINVNQTGIYFVEGIDAMGCKALDTINIAFNVPPAPDFSANDTCFNEPVQFNDESVSNSSTIVGWAWDFDADAVTDASIANPTYVFPTTGVQTVSLAVEDNLGCFNTISKNVEIYPLPTPDFGFTTECFGDTTRFTNLTPSSPGNIYSWDFGDASNSNLENPKHLYLIPGIYNAELTVTNNLGCTNTVSKSIDVNGIPSINMSSNGPICANQTLNIHADGGTSYTWTGPNSFTSTGQDIVITNTTTSDAGQYIVAVTDINNCIDVDTIDVIINPLPTATIFGTTVVCKDGTEPQVTFTGANTTAPYTFTYSIDGGTPQTISTTSGNSVTVNAPTDLAGTFTYNLISVQDNSSTTCSNSLTGSVEITINPLPTATIYGTTNVCKDEIAPPIIFTGSNGTAPYTFAYSINGGAQQTVTTSGGNSVDVDAPTGVVGTFTYELMDVQDASNTSCSNPQTGTETIIVNPLPTGSLMEDATVCQADNEPVITFTGGNGTSDYKFSYTLNGGTLQTISTSGSNTVTLNAPTDVPGTFNYILLVEEDVVTGCSSKQIDTVTIVVHPNPEATIMGSAFACQYTSGPIVSFEGINSTGSYAFTYNINSGANKTVTTNGESGVTIIAPTNIPGYYNYELTHVEDPATGCFSDLSQTITVEVELKPIARFHPDSDELTSYKWDSKMVNESLNSGLYYWDFGDGSDPSSIFSPVHEFPNDKTADYNVMLVATSSDGLCVDTTYETVHYKDELLFYIPNTFTPNGDQHNNTFLPVFTAGYDPNDFTLMIFNRWGEMIFESHNAALGWDGTYSGRIVKDGTYIWKIELQKTLTATREKYVGQVNLIR